MRLPPFPVATTTRLVVMALLLAGCSHSPTSPAPARSVSRTVTAVLTDSLGAPMAAQPVYAVSLIDEPGIIPTVLGDTDGAGHFACTLESGPWMFCADPLVVSGPPARTLVAAVTFHVPDASRPASDTVLVRLAMGTPSRVSGSTTLSTGSDHRGTMVSIIACPTNVASTDAVGAWEITDVPPGTWPLVMSHGGFAPRARTVVVPAPGSNVVVPATELSALGAQR